MSLLFTSHRFRTVHIDKLNHTVAAPNDYSYMVAAPPMDEHRAMWIGLAVGACAVFAVVSVVCWRMVISKTVRESPFNVYLLYLVFPGLIVAQVLAVVGLRVVLFPRHGARCNPCSRSLAL